MLEINIDNLDRLQDRIAHAIRDMPKIVRNAINDTAFNVRVAEQAEIAVSFSNPTNWFKKTIYVTKAKTENLNAAVGPSDYFSRGGFHENQTPWQQVMKHNVYGGTRNFKSFEKRLHRAGILPQGWFAVPGEGARLNQYGNMSPGEIVQILTYVNAMDAYAGDNTSRINRLTNRQNAMDRRGEAYFAVIPGRAGRTEHLKPGIYKRFRNGTIKPILVFVRNVTYRRRMDWFGVADRTAGQHFPAHFEREWQRVMN